MMMNTANVSDLINDFITKVWNENQLDKLHDFLHVDFVDYSLPISLPATAGGLAKWVTLTSAAFRHHTTIDAQVTDNNQAMIKIKMTLEHIGAWRDIAPTGVTVSVVGYRYFKIKDNKIAEHWALIDGNSIENQLREATHGCKIQQ
jgi:predicted ester cyclase